MTKKSALVESSTVFATHVWTMVANILVQSMLGWMLGPDGRGAYAVCVLFSTLLAAVATIGTDRAIQFGVMSSWVSKGAGLLLVVIFGLACSAIGLLIGFALIQSDLQYFQNASDSAFNLAVFLIPLVVFEMSLQLYLSGLRAFRSIALIRVAHALVQFSFVGFLLYFKGYGVEGALLSYAAASMTAITGFFWISRKNSGALHWPQLSAVFKVFSYSIRYFVARLGHIVDTGLGTLVLGFIATQGEIGLFAAVAALSLRLLLPANSVEAVLLPRVAEVADGRPELVRRVFKGMIALTLALTLLLAVLAVPVITILLSPAFKPAAAVVWLLAPGIVAQAGASMLMVFFRGTNRPGTCSTVIWCAVIVNLVSVLVLYPYIGYLAAAAGMTIGFVVRLVLLVALFVRNTSGGFFDLLLPDAQMSSDFLLVRNKVASALGFGSSK